MSTTPLVHDRPHDYLARVAESDAGRAYKQAMVAALGITSGASVIDLGCGPGSDLVAMSALAGPEGRVVGVDHDERLAEQARSRVAHLSNATVVVGDVHALEEPDASVDRLHTDRVLQHVRDPEAVMAEIARVLRPRGRAVCVEPDWATLVVDHPDPLLPQAYRRFVAERVIRNSRIGSRLPSLARRAGLVVRQVLPVTLTYLDVGEADAVLGFRRVTQRAVDAGYLSALQAQAWLAHLEQESFFASATLFATVAESPPLSG